MKLLSENAFLIPIDLQAGFDDPSQPARWNTELDENCERLILYWRILGRKIVHVKHDSEETDSPLRPDRPGNAFRKKLGPIAEETVLGKRVNSAFIDTDLFEILNDSKVDEVILFGLTTDMCVSTTARMASNLGFRTIVVSDACDCFDLPSPYGTIPAKRSHDVHLATLAYEFCDVLSTNELISRL